MGVKDPLHEGQAETDAGIATGHEGIEDPGGQLRRYAWPTVAYAESSQSALRGFDAQFDSFSIVNRGNCVREEIHHHLLIYEI